MNISQLQEAFHSFSAASKSIESYYEMLQRKINFLTLEIEKKNIQLNNALSDAEKANNFLNAVLYNIEEIIIVIDGNEQVTMINKAAEKYLQLDPHAVKGKSFNELKVSIMEDGSETFLIANGKRYNVIISSSTVIDSEDNIKGRVILIRDVSRLRELEIHNERNQRLISMGEMAAKIVHEIRNPLCSIELYASMLENDIEDLAHKKLAAGISKSISNLNNVLTNMSIFARPNKPSLKPVSLDKTIDECIEMIMPLIKSTKIKVQKSLFISQIEGDRELLKQVFFNLIINAVQAKPDESFSLLIEIKMSEDKDFVIVDIKDNGIGIEKEHHEKIFDPFFSTKESGSGLGLSISAKIIQSHNGYIKVFSEPQIGSCFRLYFRKNKNIKSQEQSVRISKRGLDAIKKSTANTCSR